MSTPLLSASNQCFNIAALLYGFAFVFYSALLVSDKKIFSSGCSWLARLGWLSHTTALVLRWMQSGLYHPPWSNLYESLVFFSWAVMGAHIFLELKRGFKLTGIFSSALAFVALGIAGLHPHKEIEPLVPALQSWWILFHVFMASIAYAFFLASSFVSVFYLLKDKVPLQKLTGLAALVCILFLAIVGGKSFFMDSELVFFKVVQMGDQSVIMNFKGPDGKLVQQFAKLPFGAAFLWATLFLYSLAAVLLLKNQKRLHHVNATQYNVKLGQKIFFLAFLFHFGLLLDMFIAPRFLPEMALKSNPYKLAAVLMTVGIAGFFLFLFRWHSKLLSKLPALKVLDRWGYEAILIGVPFMTLNLISGAIWAYYAWGRYWGWDPKETWALITWLIYIIYLHMRILGKWEGRKTAWISVFGFFIVLFTYLGVNLVISGLHSYATG